MASYTTLAKEAHAEQIIEKSRFLAHARPVNSKEDAEGFIAEIKAKYKDATHNVPCYIIGQKQELVWASDAGEPQGTSGPPVVQMLAKEGLTNLCVVVTRYFGGTKLGTGGLVRAYTSSAKLAIEAAGLHQVKNMVSFRFHMAYNLLASLQSCEKGGKFVIENIDYADKLCIKISFEEEKEKEISDMLANLGCGNIKVFERTAEQR